MPTFPTGSPASPRPRATSEATCCHPSLCISAEEKTSSPTPQKSAGDFFFTAQTPPAPSLKPSEKSLATPSSTSTPGGAPSSITPLPCPPAPHRVLPSPTTLGMMTSTPSRTSSPPRTPPSPPVLQNSQHHLDSCLAPHSWLTPWRLWTLFPLGQGCFCPLPSNFVPFPEYQPGNTTQVSLSCSTATQIKATAPWERQPIKARYRLWQM